MMRKSYRAQVEAYKELSEDTRKLWSRTGTKSS